MTKRHPGKLGFRTMHATRAIMNAWLRVRGYSANSPKTDKLIAAIRQQPECPGEFGFAIMATSTGQTECSKLRRVEGKHDSCAVHDEASSQSDQCPTSARTARAQQPGIL